MCLKVRIRPFGSKEIPVVSVKNFYTHHTQRISLAAQLGNAKAIRMSIRARKLKAFTGGVCA